MFSALTIAGSYRINAYSGVKSAYWPNGRAKLPAYQTWYNEGHINTITMAPRPPMHDFTNVDGDVERNLRELRAALADNGVLDEVSYPIAPIDTCDCVSFPDTTPFTISECTNNAYWGTFRFNLTDGSCYDVSFDESLVYENCPSGTNLEQVTQYVLCEIDFIEETDFATDTTESETETSNLRQEGTKKTHIHFSVHRLLSLALEGLLALQYPY